MINIEVLTCSNCGAPINRATMTCPYCKTQYSSSHPELRIEVVKPGAHRIGVESRIPQRFVDASPETATKMVLSEMRNKLADGLLDYMRVTTSRGYGFMDECQIIRGEVMVLDPYFK